MRDHNEDALFVITGEQEAADAVSPFGLFMLADGMGGHQSGEAASSLALRVTGGQLLSQVYMPMVNGMERGGDQPSWTDVIREAISQAHRTVNRDLPDAVAR